MKKLRAYLVSAILVLAWAMPTAMVAPHVAYAQAASCVVSGGRIIIIGGKAICFPPASHACPVTVGTLTLAPVVSRSSGVSPLLVFFDATGSTNTATLAGSNTVVQDVNFAWTYGDSSAVSGSGATWLYGSNPGGNSRNTSTGIVGAHLFIVPDGSGDTTFNVQAVAFDGTNTASCNLSVTAFDAAGANGFPGTATICAFNSAVGTGCPSGATQLTTSTMSTATASLTGGKRVLLKCGDSFSGSSTTIAGAKNSLGSYGNCPGVPITAGNQANYPQVNGTVNVNTNTASDLRISDLVINSTTNRAVDVGESWNPATNSTVQITMWNLFSNATNESYYTASCTQCGFIQLVQLQMDNNQGTFPNFVENQCVNGSTALDCGQGSSPVFDNVMYTAFMGGSYNGVGAPNTGAGIETVRISACRMCVVSNNLIENANNVGAVLKFHSGNAESQPTFLGQFTENIEVSDNDFAGTSGAQLVEILPQNAQDDERMRLMVWERNQFTGVTTGGGRQIWVGGQNITLRDNVFNGAGVGSLFESRWCPTGTVPTCAGSSAIPFPVQNFEFYNNTCTNGADCAQMVSTFASPGSAGNNGFLQNNLIFNNSGTFTNTGTGNTITNNTTTTTLNPGFTDGSGSFSLLSDFRPTANFTIPCTPFPSCTAVPVAFDALGVPWSPTWDFGAVHH